MSLHEKLVAIQSELKAPKGQMNNFGKYKYRSCEDILEAVKPLLKQHSISLLLSDTMVDVGGRVYVKATAQLHDPSDDKYPFITVDAYARESADKKGMDEAQITGAASSYARKYALNGLFCIDDTKDSDATNTHDEKPKAKPISPPVDNCSTEQMKQIADLCKETNTNQAKLYETMSAGLTPTKFEAQKMIVSLKAKLGKQIEAAASKA